MIAMSGGVDSSIAAYLMKLYGYEAIGVTLKLHGCLDEGACGSASDADDAKKVAESLGMEHFLYDFSNTFEDTVIKRFADSYERGHTPNPCIDCNRYIKFGALYDKMLEHGCDSIVTGHYARVEYDETRCRYLLKKGADETKDQSYVLYNLTKEQLAHVEFPLGGMPKTEVRALAEEQGFVNAKKKDSQDICFVPDGDYAAFIKEHFGKSFPEGDFVDRDGNVLGRHKGIIHYTVGQRKGLGLSLPCPMYVTEKNVEENKVVLGYNEDLFFDNLTATDVNLISVDDIREPMRVTAKVRYGHKAEPATAVMLDDGRLQVTFDSPVRAITKGQAVVLYDGDIVVGGGRIE